MLTSQCPAINNSKFYPTCVNVSSTKITSNSITNTQISTEIQSPVSTVTPSMSSSSTSSSVSVPVTVGNTNQSLTAAFIPSLVSSSAVTVPFPLQSSSLYLANNKKEEPLFSSNSNLGIRNLSSGVRINGLSSSNGGGKSGPAFVGQVFSMLDPSGNGLMTVTSRFDIPFISTRTPEWIKKAFSRLTKRDHNGPVFRFFMDLSDAVTHVKRLNIPTGMVGACRLDVAYQHFKEEPHLFQFVPNEKQVKAANKLLKEIPTKERRSKIDGVPVFTAQNLNIAIATNDGIKWYTPYFFDKNLLDNILEASVDQHFHTLIQNRHTHRRRDLIDDGLTAEVVEESVDSMFEPPEVQEVLDEMGHSGIPMSIISKAAEIQFLDVVDQVLLGNKWLRKATGIQPKFPYMVDSFEKRSAASLLKATAITSSCVNSKTPIDCEAKQEPSSSKHNLNENTEKRVQAPSHTSFQFPFGDWLSNPWSKLQEKTNAVTRTENDEGDENKFQMSPLLPRITMVGVSMGETAQVSKAKLKKTMDELTKELEQSNHKSLNSSEETDPLFVANVGDYSSITNMHCR